ncbi:hypothetical protein C9374_000056 [Naegleria lovaniensis]|uniref:Uncharacterized protein n=1 Tax=Naegleria lovaniensis TaxID=51637 RepID=A0AA88KTE6_NAELO|nr:uncharacterized protein C9374_000056 [Naegleria lovaniensis]KAG2388617.1 hypothetical protein C9374_000056 [Naegleria lovaniensis]
MVNSNNIAYDPPHVDQQDPVVNQVGRDDGQAKVPQEIQHRDGDPQEKNNIGYNAAVNQVVDQHGNEIPRQNFNDSGQAAVPREEGQQQPPPQLLPEEIAINARLTGFGMDALSFSIDGNQQKLAHSLIFLGSCLFYQFSPANVNLNYIIWLFNSYGCTKVPWNPDLTLDNYRQLLRDLLSVIESRQTTEYQNADAGSNDQVSSVPDETKYSILSSTSNENQLDAEVVHRLERLINLKTKPFRVKELTFSADADTSKLARDLNEIGKQFRGYHSSSIGNLRSVLHSLEKCGITAVSLSYNEQSLSQIKYAKKKPYENMLSYILILAEENVGRKLLEVHIDTIKEGLDDFIYHFLSYSYLYRSDEVDADFYSVLPNIHEMIELYYGNIGLTPLLALQTVLSVLLNKQNDLPKLLEVLTSVTLSPNIGGLDWSLDILKHLRKYLTKVGKQHFEYEYLLTLLLTRLNLPKEWTDFWKSINNISSQQFDWCYQIFVKVYSIPNSRWISEALVKVNDPHKSQYLQTFLTTVLRQNVDVFHTVWNQLIENVGNNDIGFWTSLLFSVLPSTFSNQIIEKLISSVVPKNVTALKEETVKNILNVLNTYPTYQQAYLKILNSRIPWKTITVPQMKMVVNTLPSTMVDVETLFAFFKKESSRKNLDSLLEILGLFIEKQAHVPFDLMVSIVVKWLDVMSDLEPIISLLKCEQIAHWSLDVSSQEMDTLGETVAEVLSRKFNLEKRLQAMDFLLSLLEHVDVAMPFVQVFSNKFVISCYLSAGSSKEKQKVTSQLIKSLGAAKRAHLFFHILFSYSESIDDVGAFVDSINMYLGIISVWKKYKNHDEEVEEKFNQCIRTPIRKMKEKIADQLVTYEELELLTKNKKIVSELFKEVGITKEIDWDTWLKYSLKTKQEYEQYKNMIAWFREFPSLSTLLAELEQPSFAERITISDMEDQLSVFQGMLSEFDKEDTKHLVLHFQTNKSLLFNSLFNRFLHDKSVSTFEDAADALREVISFLKDIEKSTIRELKEYQILEVAKMIRSKGTTLKREIEMISEAISSVGSSDANEVDLNSLRRALELEEIGLGIEVLRDCLQDYNMDIIRQNSFKDLLDLGERLKSLLDLKLDSVHTMLQKTSEILPGLEAFHFSYFSMLLTPESKALLQFIKDNSDNFEESVKIVRARSRSTKFHEELVNSLMIAKELITPFLNSRVSLGDLIKKVIDIFKREEDLSKLNDLKIVNDNLTTVKVLFSKTSIVSLDDIFEIVSTIMKSGHYISNLQTGELVIHYSVQTESSESKKEVFGDELLDLVGISIFRSSDTVNDLNDSASLKNDLKFFVMMYQTALKAHSVILSLFKEGHPKYQQSNLIALCEDMTLESLEQGLCSAETTLKEWKTAIKHLTEQVPRILKLSRPQLTQFVSILLRVSKLGETNNCSFSHLIPYLCTMLNDDLESLQEGVSVEMVKNTLSTVLQENENSDILELVKRFMESLLETLYIDSEIETSSAKYQSKVIFDMKSKDIPLSIIGIMTTLTEKATSLIQYSNIFYCHSGTTKEEMQWFNSRRKIFADSKYVIVGVNNLGLSVKEELVKFEYDAFDSGKSVGETFLLFTSDMGRDSFSFIGTISVVDLAVDDHLKKHIRTSFLSNQCKIKDIHLVKGPICCGKSRFIKKKQSSDNEQYIRISVREDFSKLQFFENLSRYEESKKQILFHFDISCFAEFLDFEKFILEWLLGGYLHLDDGKIVINPWNTDIESIRLFFEIPCTLDKREPDLELLKFLSFSNMPTVLDANVGNFDYSSKKARYVATVLSLFNKRSVNNIASFMQAEQNLVSSHESKDILCDLFRKCEISSTHAHRKLFIKLMHERFKGLSSFHKHYIDLRNSGTEENLETVLNVESLLNSINAKLIPIFKEECIVMANDEIKQSWMNLPVLFAVPSDTGMIKEYDIIKCSGCKKQTNIENMRILDIDKENESKIRSMLNTTFNTNVTNLCESTDYLLTKDFVIKIHLVNERRKVGKSLILQSETGTGKTEMLRFYADVLNSHSNICPDIRYELNSNWFKQEWKKLQDKIQIEERKTVNDDKEKIKENIIELLRTTEDQFGNDEYLELVKSLIRFVKHLFESYKLLERTTAISAIFNAFESNDFTSFDIKNIAEWLSHIEAARPSSIFHKILMHSGITADQIRKEISDILDKKQKCLEQGIPDLITVVFIDELNTTSCMGMIKELMIDHSLDGVKLPKSIFFIGAINPKNKTKSALLKEGYQVSKVSSKNRSKLPGDEDVIINAGDYEGEYIVNDMAPSMELIKFDYGDLSPAQEHDFLRLLLEQEQKKRDVQDVVTTELQQFIYTSQRFVAEARLHKIRVSIRDLTRANKLYWFLRENEVIRLDPNENTEENKHVHGIIMSIALNYYFRLPHENREKFERVIDDLVKNQFPHYSYLQFGATVKTCLRDFYQRAKECGFIPDGIAHTQAFAENLFAMIVCIQSVTPLSIVGSPGNSKTLSYTCATQKKRSLFPTMKTVHSQHYQCNELSTASEIETVLKSSVETKKKYERAGMLNELCSLLIDEASLPIEQKHALKCIHYYLDKPYICTVLISNMRLDAAKSNRAIQIIQPSLSFDDLQALCKGVLMLDDNDANSYSRNGKIITALCKSFQQVNEVLQSPIVQREPEANQTSANIASCGIFHMRDFVFFLRMLRRNAGGGDLFSPNNIYYSLQRNLNGVFNQDFEAICNLFFTNIRRELGTNDFKIYIPSTKKYMQVVEDSITDRLNIQQGEDPNQSHFRYTMIIDPSESQSSIELLFKAGKLKQKTKVVYISDFKEDSNDLSLSQEISEVKQAMEEGACVILVNSAAINSSFYDVFNRHFTTINDRYFANVSIRGTTHPCLINPQFHCILHVPLSQYRTMPIPLLNRFEKYIVGAEQILQDAIPIESITEKQNILKHIRDGVTDFIQQFHPETFYGLTPNETVDSLMLRVIHDSTEEISIKKPLAIRNEKIIRLMKEKDIEDHEEDDNINTGTSSKRLREYIRSVNFLLLQICPPENIYLKRNIIPISYLIEYLTHQEHFSAISFLKNAIQYHFTNNLTEPSKYLLYLRHSSGIQNLPESSHIHELLTSHFQSPDYLLDDDAPLNVITVASVSSFSSQIEICELLDNFAENPNKLVLIFTVDMSSISKQVVNYIKFKVDNMLSSSVTKINGLKPFVSLLLHFPPECAQFKAAYDTIFTDWSYYYVDSLLTPDIVNGSQNHVDKGFEKYQDARYWFCVAVGLINSFDLEDRKQFQQAFIPLYETTLVENIRENSSIISSTLLNQYFVRQRKFSLPQKSEFVEHLLKNFKPLRDIILNMFSEKWNTKEISSIVNNICQGITSGTVVNGIIQSISNALSSKLMEMMYSITRKLILLTPSVENLSQPNMGAVELQTKIMEMFIKTSLKKNKYNERAASSSQMVQENLHFSSLLLDRIENQQSSDLILEEITDIIEMDKNMFEKFRWDAIAYHFSKDIIKDAQSIKLVDILLSPTWKFDEKRRIFKLISYMKQERAKNYISLIFSVLIEFKFVKFLESDEFVKSLGKVGLVFEKALEHIYRYSIEFLFTSLATAMSSSDMNSLCSCKGWLNSLNFFNMKHFTEQSAFLKNPMTERIYLLNCILNGLEDMTEPTPIKDLWHRFEKKMHDQSKLSECFKDVVEMIHPTLMTYLSEDSQRVFINNLLHFTYIFSLEHWTVPSLTQYLEVIHLFEGQVNGPSIWKMINLGSLSSIMDQITRLLLENRLHDNLRKCISNYLNKFDNSMLIPEDITLNKQHSVVTLLQSSYISHKQQMSWISFLENYVRANNSVIGCEKLDLCIDNANSKLLLIKFAEHLVEKNNPKETIEGLTAETKQLLLNAMGKHSNMPLFLLSRYATDDHLEQVITSNRAELASIGLGNYHLENIVKDYKSYHFTFMHNRQHPIYNIFSSMRDRANNPQEFENYVLQQAPQHKYTIRMLLVVISYNYYFLQMKRCDAVLSCLQKANVRTALSIEDVELPAFTKFASEPISVPAEKQQHEFTEYYLSKEFIASDHDKILLHLFANITAVTLGVPKEKNHLYNRMFHPEVLANSFGPGSTYQDQNWDCGFIVAGVEIANIANTNIMNRSQMHHAALNTLTWAAFTLCVLFDPARNQASAKGGHMCNYVEDMNYVKNISALEKLQLYIKTRVNTFMTIFSMSPETMNRVDPIIFFTNALERFMSQASSSNDCLGFFNERGEKIRRYETFWMNNCFIPVLNDYGNIVNKMNEQTQLLQRISQFKEASMNIRKVRDVFISQKSILHLLYERFSEVENNNGAYETLRQVIKFKHWLSFSDYIQDFIAMYIELHRGLSGKLEEHEIHITIKDAIRRMTREKQQEIQDLWTRVKQNWSDIKHKTLQALGEVVCQQAERDIIDLNDDTILSSVLHVAEGNNAIGMMIKNIYVAQSSIQQSYSSSSYVYAESAVHITDKLFNHLLFIHLKEDHLCEMVKSFLIVKNNRNDFDWTGLEFLFKESLAKGRITIQILDSAPLTPSAKFEFKKQNVQQQSDKNVEAAIDEIEDEENAYKNSIDYYFKILTEYEAELGENENIELVDDKKKTLLSSIDTKNVNEVLKLAKDLCVILEHHKLNVPNYLSYAPNGSVLKKLKKVKDSELYSLLQTVLDIIYNREEAKTLYEKFAAAQFRYPLTSGMKKYLDKIGKELEDQVKQQDPNIDKNPLLELFEQSIKHQLSYDIQVSHFLPKTITTRETVAYIEYLRRLIGKIGLHRSEVVVSSRNCYTEKVPNSLASSARLSNSDSILQKFGTYEEKQAYQETEHEWNNDMQDQPPFMYSSPIERISKLREAIQRELDTSKELMEELAQLKRLERLLRLKWEAQQLRQESEMLQQQLKESKKIRTRMYLKGWNLLRKQ